jgi:hypothetical protein
VVKEVILNDTIIEDKEKKIDKKELSFLIFIEMTSTSIYENRRKKVHF